MLSNSHWKIMGGTMSGELFLLTKKNTHAIDTRKKEKKIHEYEGLPPCALPVERYDKKVLVEKEYTSYRIHTLP